ncbi:unnamed protein product [Paramecium sonneborni]|uniref:Uncharacterized protein n=1 Tax=Paramecium sonneborni TaxID=65129 RepID=A0A8S1R7J0_9CILI|nr:unnamed protein product [Paramecium sonneborni]
MKPAIICASLLHRSKFTNPFFWLIQFYTLKYQNQKLTNSQCFLMIISKLYIFSRTSLIKINWYIFFK